MKAAEVRRRLQARYGRTTDGVKMPEHLVAFEVPIDGRPRWADMPEVRSRQRIDAVAVGLWRRTEHLVHGFEIKVSRADLLAELRDPSKSAAAVDAVDRWSLVLGDPRLLRDGDDLPDGWGMFVPHGRGLRELIAPAPQPGNLDRRTLAGIVQASMRSHGACRGLGVVAGVSSTLERIRRTPYLAESLAAEARRRRP